MNSAKTTQEFLEYFVSGSIDSIPFRCFVDCGCAATTINKQLFSRHFGRVEDLDNQHEVAIAFNGSTTPIYGNLLTKIQFGEKEYPINFKVVESSHYDIILGLDFINPLVKYISPSDSNMVFNDGNAIGLEKYQIETTTVPILRSSEPVVIPANTISFVPCTLVGPIEDKYASYCLTNTHEFLLNTGLGVANCLITPRIKVAVQVVNPTESAIEVSEGTKVAELEQCEQLPYSILKEVPNNALQSRSRSSLISLKECNTDKSFLSESEAAELQSLLDKYKHVFATERDEPGRTSLVEHHIDLIEGTRPFKQTTRRFPIHLQDEADKEVQKLLDNHIVEQSNSEFSSPPFWSARKTGASGSALISASLMQKTIKDSYPLPRICEAIDSIGKNSKYFTTLDLAMGYHHVPIAEDDKHKTAFPSRFGLLQYTVMPFGLTNAPATFQRLMERVLSHMNWKDCLVYIDDVLIWSHTFAEHLQKLESVFQSFRESRTSNQSQKVSHLLPSSTLLGHLITESGIKMDPNRIKAVSEMQHPTTKQLVQRYLGFISYYRQVIPNLSRIETPIRQILIKEQFEWKREKRTSPSKLSRSCSNVTLYRLPRHNPALRPRHGRIQKRSRSGAQSD